MSDIEATPVARLIELAATAEAALLTNFFSLLKDKGVAFALIVPPVAHLEATIRVDSGAEVRVQELWTYFLSFYSGVMTRALRVKPLPDPLAPLGPDD